MVHREQKQSCPSCGASVSAHARICVHCGYNLATGQRHGVMVESDDDEPDLTPPPPPRWVQYLNLLGELFPGFARPFLAIFAMVIAGLGVCIIVFGMMMLLMFHVFITAYFMCAMGVLIWAQAMGWLMTGEWYMLQDCLVEFEGPRMTVFVLLVLLPVAGLIVLMNVIAGSTP